MQVFALHYKHPQLILHQGNILIHVRRNKLYLYFVVISNPQKNFLEKFMWREIHDISGLFHGKNKQKHLIFAKNEKLYPIRILMSRTSVRLASIVFFTF